MVKEYMNIEEVVAMMWLSQPEGSSIWLTLQVELSDIDLAILNHRASVGRLLTLQVASLKFAKWRSRSPVIGQQIVTVPS